MASVIFVSLLLILSSIFCQFTSGRQTETHHVISLSSLLAPETVCSSTQGHNRSAALPLVHRHGPCSPLPAAEKKTPLQFLRQDQLRVNSIQSRVSTRQTDQLDHPLDSVAESSLPAKYGIALNTANYVVNIGFGTPKQDMTVVFDTGSDLTWVQCEPCVSYCHAQQDPIFDPSKSSSYTNISCSSAECAQLKSATGNSGGCSSSTCVYGISYGDQSSSVGFLGSESLTLTSSDSVKNFRFGCGQKNRGLFGNTAGLLGLGRDKISLVSQSAPNFGQVFSYCLPSSSRTTGFLSFGTPKASSSFKYTPTTTKIAFSDGKICR